MTPTHFDRNETRPAKSREAALFRDLKAIVSVAKPRAAALRRQIRGVDMAAIRAREDLARIPVLRDAEIARLRADEPPFGGMAGVRTGFLRHLFLGAAAGQAKDWWGAGRALWASGFERGDVVLNCFSYHMKSSAHMIESGAHALGCAVIPAGPVALDRQYEAIHTLRPAGYCGKPHYLKSLLDRASEHNCDMSSIRKALVFGAPMSETARRDMERRGLRVAQAYVAPSAGVIAYETRQADGALNEGMVVNEDVILEIVKPGGHEPLGVGEVGEVVVTRLNVEFPLLRFATGDLSMLLPGASPCGRTNARIKGWMGRVEEATWFNGRMLLPSDVVALQARHDGVSRMRLIVRAEGADQETLLLRAEAASEQAGLAERLRESVKATFGVDAQIEIAAPSALASDRRLIVDERLGA